MPILNGVQLPSPKDLVPLAKVDEPAFGSLKLIGIFQCVGLIYLGEISYKL